MTTLKVLLEVLLMLAVPIAPLAAGVVLRRRNAYVVSEDAEPAGRTLKRWAGNALIAAGALIILLMAFFALHFQGKF